LTDRVRTMGLFLAAYPLNFAYLYLTVNSD